MKAGPTVGTSGSIVMAGRHGRVGAFGPIVKADRSTCFSDRWPLLPRFEPGRKTRSNSLSRTYKGHGPVCLGEVEGANLIKIHRRSGKPSYLVYPDFDDDPHPALLRSIRVNLRTRQIDSNDYGQSANPPVLHRKETFLTADHPLHARFARLTAEEEKHGLLDDWSRHRHAGKLVEQVGRAGILPEGAPARAFYADGFQRRPRGRDI